jgi:hypothetical protein
MADEPISVPEIASRNSLPTPAAAGTDDLETWLEAYFQLAVNALQYARPSFSEMEAAINEE